MGSDQRQFLRVPLSLEVQYSLMGDFLVDYTSNISLGGCFVMTDRINEFQVGDNLQMTLVLPNQTVLVKAIVRWISTHADQRGLGVQYEFMNATDQATIEGLIKGCQKPNAI